MYGNDTVFFNKLWWISEVASTGEILACQISPGNVDDRKPVPALCKRLYGKLIADRGHISQPLFEQLLETFNVQLITCTKKEHEESTDAND